MDGVNLDEVTERRIALDVFADVRRAFPHLQMRLLVEDPHVDVMLDIQPQAGLAFHINLNLQGDELHLSVGEAFWMEWFPCTDEQVVAMYRDAVFGLLSGDFRILEHHRDGRAVRADLQRRQNDEWETVTSWARLHLPLPWRKRYYVLQNVPSASSAPPEQ